MGASVTKPRVMVLGTFHMSPSNDMFNVEVDNLLGSQRQDEIRECADRIKRYEPTKVALEVVTDYGEAINEAYRLYLQGDLALGVNETHQLGFRIAGDLGHDRVYALDGVDWNTWLW